MGPPKRIADRRRHRIDVEVDIEVSMVEAALNAAAEQVIEYTAYGNIPLRLGNRSRDAAPQGLYRCRGDEQWLAISVASDEQWAALKAALGQADWADNPELDTHEGRWCAHDLIDKHLSRWASAQSCHEAAEMLSAAGVLPPSCTTRGSSHNIHS